MIIFNNETLKQAVKEWIDNPDTAKTKYGHISDWNVSNVTNMNRMFFSAESFNQDIGKWDVSKVTDMSWMFFSAKSFNQDIGKWDVSKVENMNYMFFSAKSFNQDIGQWDVSNVIYMEGVFSSIPGSNSNSSFNKDIGNWNVSNVTNMKKMFDSTESFNQDIGAWDVSNVTDMESMFSRANSFNQDIGKWDVSKVTDMRAMFLGASSFNQDLSKWNVSKVIDMGWMFDNATSFNQDLSNWDKKKPKEVSKQVEFNSIIRLCFESVPDELGNDLCLVKGALIIIQERNSKWAYGYHIKNQGGGTVGEYHLILKAREDKEMEHIEWESAIGNFREFEVSTAADLKGFNEDEAMQMFDELDSLWGSTLHWGGSVNEEVEYPYDELFLCYKSKFPDLEESQGSFWYVKDNISDAEDFLQYLDIESVSGAVPGNMSFIS